LIEIDRDRAARYGLNVSDIQDVIETGLAGKAATESGREKTFQCGGEISGIRAATRQSQKSLVDTPEGLHIPLEQVATFKVGNGSMNIQP